MQHSFTQVYGLRSLDVHFILFLIAEKILKFVSCGSESIEEVENSISVMMPDDAFEGGHVLRTNENIVDGGHFASLYQSARVGNFCYRFDSLSAQDYFVDFHFAEIINTNGPKGMRVFDVFMQEEKVRLVLVKSLIVVLIVVMIMMFMVISFISLLQSVSIGLKMAGYIQS